MMLDRSENQLVLKVVGKINEEMSANTALMNFANAFPIEDREKDNQLSLDVGGVIQINSTGIREWLVFFEKLQAMITCKFTMVSEAMIEQAVVIPAILGKKGTEILAFQAPYYCRQCDIRALQVLETKLLEINGSKIITPVFKCIKCGNPLELDIVESEYLNFLKNKKG
jgi:hypothetical protein